MAVNLGLSSWRKNTDLQCVKKVNKENISN
jgi:hypothetical protein